MPWYIIAAATPVFYSFAIFIDKFLVDKKLRNPIVITSINGLISGSVGIVIALITGFKFIGITQTALVVLGGILLNWYLLPYYAAIKIDDVSRVVPLYQFLPVFTLIISTVFFKETLTIRQIVGMGFVIFAGILLSVEKLDIRFLKPRKSLWFMILSCLMYGMVGLLFRFTSKNTPYWSLFSYEYIGAGLGGLLLFAIPSVNRDFIKDIKKIRASTGLLLTERGLGFIAQSAEAYAVTLVAVPLVNIVNGIQPLIILIFGLFLTRFFPHLIKENVTPQVLTQKLVSILIIIVGLYLVYF